MKKKLKIIIAAFTLLVSLFTLSLTNVKVNAEDGKNYFFADFNNASEAYAAGNEVNKELLSEGIILLKNEDNALPLGENAKLSLFGVRSTNLLYGGGGSGAGAGGSKLSLADSLKNAGFSVNDKLTTFYKNNQTANGGSIKNYGVYPGPTVGMGEAPVSKFQADSSLEASYAEYSDAALIVFGRAGTEAGDSTKGMASSWDSNGNLNASAPVSGARSYDDHYLQLDKNETDLISYVSEHFEKIIIVLNTASQVEVGFLDDPGHYAYSAKIKAALWIGYPGVGDGLNAFGEILAGKTNPSGHTVDTWSRDFKADPTWYNMPTYTNNLFKYTNLRRSFANYSEGIYSGYRYYETRGFTEGDGEVMQTVRGTSTTKWKNWYSSAVSYPFGHGLSYTEFTWKLIDCNIEENSALAADSTIKFTIEVKNTGSVAGKEVVQLYYTAPYVTGQIEKAHVVLCGYEKTKLLSPGEAENVVISVKARDMASYDYSDANGNGFKGYELDAGDYVLKLSKNAHQSVIEKTFKVADGGIKFATNESGNTVENRFDKVSEHIAQYMTRADFAGTFPTEPTSADRVASQAVIDEVNNTSVNDKIAAEDTPDKPYYSGQTPTTGADNGIVLKDLYGLDYNDEKWEKFLDQLTVGDKNTAGTMAYTIWNGGWSIFGNSKLGIPDTAQEDGPSGINGKNVKGSYSNFASETVTASTWNKELAKKKGLILGNQALVGGSKYVNGIYAPAVNIHRSAFGGRNFEYFSEDAYLSGVMAGEIVKGCNEKGLITYLKHFAVNDQESQRDNLLTWLDEQTLREIYLKPFEICVEDYDCHGIMTALNSIGATWTGGNYELITEVLRGEWNFKGLVITDYVQGRGQLNGNQAIRAGGDFLLATKGSVQNPVALNSATTVTAMRKAMHNILYATLNYTACFNSSKETVLGAYEGGALDPAIDSMPYEATVATVKINGNIQKDKVKYALKEGSKLPTGLTLDENGTISGTATTVGESGEFTVVASYSLCKKEATFTLPVADKATSVIYVKKENAKSSYLGKAFDFSVDWAYTLDGKTHDITYSLAEGSSLPKGLTLSSDGKISGTAQEVCIDYPVSIVASAPGMRSMTVKLTISTFKGVIDMKGELKGGVFGKDYAVSVADSSLKGVNYSLKAGSKLPSGLTLTGGGTIVGKPLEAGKITFTVVADGEYLEQTEREFTLEVAPAYTGKTLDTVKVGSEFETYINFAEGVTDANYSLFDGTLPEGVTLTKDGVLKGAVKKAGSYSFTVKITSSAGEAYANFVLKADGAKVNSSYGLGLAIGIAAIVLLLGAGALYIFVIQKGNKVVLSGSAAENAAATEAKAGKVKVSKKFIVSFTSAVAAVLAVVIVFSVVNAPISESGSVKKTFVFEAEYVNLDDFMGAGISNSAVGVNNIYGDGLDKDKEAGWSNGYFLGNTYAINTITFEIESDGESSAQLVLRLASELGNLSLNESVFGIEVNGKEISYNLTVANSSAGNYDFADYPISAPITLLNGKNTIKLIIKDNTLKDGNSVGAPLIDCIKIASSSTLTWNPLTDNPDQRGSI